MQALLDMISSGFNFIISMFTGLYDIIRMFPMIINTLTTSIGYMPDFMIGFASITVVVMVAFVIAGRGGDAN